MTEKNNFHFFADNETHTWLILNYESDQVFKKIETCTIEIDVTEQPFYCIATSEKDGITVKLYIRNELGIFVENPEVCATFQVGTEKPQIISASNRIGAAEDTVVVFYKSVAKILEYIEKDGKMKECICADSKSEGVVVTLNEEKLSFKHVEGKKRPDLACTTLFGGISMMRTYQDEIIDAWSVEEMSIEELTELAEDNDESAMDKLAQKYLNGDGIEQDFEKSAYWWEKLANTDNSIGQFNIGLHYAKGCGVKRDFAKATEWLKKASENGDEDADFIIEKIEKAVKAEKIVSTGDAQAQADMAATYMFLGNSLDQMGPDQDYKLAFELAKKSADQNNGDGIWALALCYEHGRGVKKDVKKAVDCYKKGSLIGHPPSLHSLACYYARGEIVPKNMKMAFELSIRSAEYGYGLAMQTVGSCYQFANGVVGNMDTAIKWYETTLKFIDDFELERKVQGFKMMQEADPKSAKEEYHGIDSTKKLIAADREFLDKVDAAIEVNSTLEKCKEVEPLLKKFKEVKKLEEEKKRAEAEKKAREAEEKRLKEEKRKDEIYNTIIAAAPKTVSEVESIIKKLEGLGEWKDSASKLKEFKEKLTVLKAEEKRIQEEKRLAEEKKRKEEEERKRIRKEKYDAYLEKYPLKKEEPQITQEIESLKKEIDGIVIVDENEKKTFKFLGIFFVIGLLDLVLGIASEMVGIAVIGVVCTLLFGFVLCLGVKANIAKSSNKRMKQKRLTELEAKMQEIASIPEFE